MNITDEMLDKLRVQVGEGLSDKRYTHILEVEKMAERLSDLYCPDKKQILRAAALLHDVTKEWTGEKQIEYLTAHGVALSPIDYLAPKTFHAMSAALLIPEKFKEFNDAGIVSCVRWHTVGHAGMTLCEKLIYLADYIDMSRKFADCVKLRELFWSADPEKMTMDERLLHLDRVMLTSYDMTVTGLIAEGLPICNDTFSARNALIVSLKERERI